jgi:hypothetical protein
VGRVEGSAMYQKWYFEVTVDHIEQTTHMMPHLRIGWANTAGYVCKLLYMSHVFLIHNEYENSFMEALHL